MNLLRTPTSRIRQRVVAAAILLAVSCALVGVARAGQAESDPILSHEVSATDIAGATELVHALPLTDWLGPLAPLALSPFFGITCLSALSLWGSDWLPVHSGLIGPQSPLASPVVFFSFLLLTILTSLPRLSKVSKPFAQAVDHLEAYAGIATILLLKILIPLSTGGDEPAVAYVQAGVLSVTLDALLMAAMALNIIVVQTVRFFFEFLIWITPLPFIDAIFEVANKMTCAALMALYAYSPSAATALNLAIVAACLVVFRWVYRRVVFCRTMALDPILSCLWPRRANPRHAQLVVFPTASFGPFPARAKLILRPVDQGWELRRHRWFRSPERMLLAFEECNPTLRSGIVANVVEFHASNVKPCSFSKRYRDLEAVAEQLRVAPPDSHSAEATGSPGAELA